MKFQDSVKTYPRVEEVNGRSEGWEEVKQDVSDVL